jgi:hypothetical protein
MITTQTKDTIKNPDNVGSELDEGECYGTFISDVSLCYFSKVEILDFSMPYYQMSQRQEADLDRLHYSIIKVEFLIDKNGQRYYENTDFEIKDGQIKWYIGVEGAHVPSRGMIYSANYTHRPVYRSLKAMHQNRFSTYMTKIDHTENISLPEQWLLKLDFLLFARKNPKINKVYEPGDGT